MRYLFFSFVMFFYLSCGKSLKNIEEIKADSLSHPISSRTINAANLCESLNGKVYTYLPSSNKELHLFSLKFDCLYDTLIGTIFGPFPQGDHGLAFYRTQLKDLIVDDSLNISFSIVPGKLYEKQITLDNYRDNLEAFGIDRGEQFFKGCFLADTLIRLNCVSEYYDCYTTEVMNFKIRKNEGQK
jgi:hypothetical protein